MMGTQSWLHWHEVTHGDSREGEGRHGMARETGKERKIALHVALRWLGITLAAYTHRRASHRRRTTRQTMQLSREGRRCDASSVQKAQVDG